jgi:crotonobetainyl-CoA:carnitine CoA-transferase CaiB-like acyl-CoA transferase
MLKGYRALDLTDEKGFLCGRILGDLGVDVIKVEKPGGDVSRNIGPFYHDETEPEKSLYWFAFNANKRGVTLDITSEEGKALFKKLLKKSHFIIESFPPGYMDKLGLGYQELSRINPGIILVSITPFGQKGPYKDYKASDIVLMAMGGFMSLTGDKDRPPVRISLPQAYLHGGVQAASAAMVALYGREKTGEGQHIDLSIQHAITVTALNTPAFWFLNQTIIHRAGPCRVGGRAHLEQRNTWPCKDGYVTTILTGGELGAPVNRRLVKWMDSEGMANDLLKNMEWERLDMANVTAEMNAALEEPIGRFFKAHTKKELHEEAIRRQIWLFPVQTCEELTECPQLLAREFWVDVEHPELRVSVAYPGSWIKSSELHCGIRHCAPYPGEHNQQVYEEEMGMSREEMASLKQAKII